MSHIIDAYEELPVDARSSFQVAQYLTVLGCLTEALEVSEALEHHLENRVSAKDIARTVRTIGLLVDIVETAPLSATHGDTKGFAEGLLGRLWTLHGTQQVSPLSRTLGRLLKNYEHSEAVRNA